VLPYLPPLFSPLHLFIAGCTLMVYNLHFLLRKSLPQVSDRLRWTVKHKLWHYAIFFAGLLLSSISIFFLSWHIMIACVLLGILSFMYTLPLLPFAKSSLRDFGWLKILTLTLVWTIVTSVLPLLYWEKTLLDYPYEILIRFTFLFTLCVAFDVRDMQTDLRRDIRTLPNLIGERNSYRLMDASIALFIILSIIQYLRYPSTGRLIAEILSAVATRLVIMYTKKHSSDRVYLGMVDGMMLLYGCLIALLS
jgi:4-hydroxybenzoate polyprenyltransferase